MTSVLFLFLSCRILFKDKDRNWDEIETKLRSESDIPLLKTSNKVQKSVNSEQYLMTSKAQGYWELIVFFSPHSSHEGDFLNSSRTEES